MKLSQLFDGEQHELMPGEDFALAEDRWAVGELEEEDDSDLLPYESPSYATEFVTANSSLGETDESAWGLFSVAMAGLCKIIEGKREQYQHNEYTNGGSTLVGTRYTFRYEAAETGWTGERF